MRLGTRDFLCGYGPVGVVGLPSVWSRVGGDEPNGRDLPGILRTLVVTGCPEGRNYLYKTMDLVGHTLNDH